MNLTELRMTLRPLPLLDTHAEDPDGVLQVRSRPVPRFLVWRTDALEQVFRADLALDHLPSNTLAPLLGRRSLLWTDGPRHRWYRRLIGPAMHGPNLAGYRPAIADTITEAVDALVAGTEFGLADWTRRLTLRIIARIMFGRADDAVLTTFADWMNQALGSRPRTLAYRYLAHGLPRSGPELDELLLAAAMAAATLPTPTLAAVLLAGSPALTDGELRDQIVSLLFAGHETTASALAWTLFRLEDADLRANVTDELAATSDDGSDATRVPLLQAVIQETLRLHPPAPVAGNRALTENGELCGRPLTAGTVLVPSVYLAHHRSTEFPRPYRFDPSRFVGAAHTPPGYLPFGGGTRYCLGSELALLEIRMAVVALLRGRAPRCVNPDAAAPHLRGPAMAPSRRLRMAVPTTTPSR
jgi:cytochrome P450